ncbi:MAG: response regulator [Betaproteobacteria bacterium]|nr:response regulator [Betaproteobacteria bacterium]
MNTQVPQQVLVVDDEPNIVSSVRRELMTASGRYRYAVEGFSDPVQALERAKTQHFDVVISDFRMPGMDGMEFLKAFAQIQPDCARMVLSGQTDMATLVKMVNETHIYRFIPKPWHDYYLKGSVAQAIQYNSVLLENKQLAQVVRDLKIPIPSLIDNNIDQILLVDDDPNILGSMSRVLTHHSRMDELYSAIRAEVASRSGPVLEEGKISVQVTPSALHALKMADAISYSCIIADFKMPEMNGVDLLQKFMDKQPDCIRILVSGVISQEELVYAVDSAYIFGFIAKPWQDFELKSLLAQALAYRRMLAENLKLAEMVRQARRNAADS